MVRADQDEGGGDGGHTKEVDEHLSVRESIRSMHGEGNAVGVLLAVLELLREGGDAVADVSEGVSEAIHRGIGAVGQSGLGRNKVEGAE